MGAKVHLRWKAWYGDEELTLNFPLGWRIQVAQMHDAPSAGEAEIEKAFSNPVGSAPVEELASGKKSVAIAVDDLTRPTPAHQLLPPLLKRLKLAGIADRDVTIIAAVGAHRPMTRPDFVKKCGKWVVNTFFACNHNPYDSLLCIGRTGRGPITVNRIFAEADIKIGVGTVCPHGEAGFSGGAKIVLPGVAGIESLECNHRPTVEANGDKTALLGNVEANETRQDMEEFAAKVGLDFIVNVVINSRRDIADVFTGHPVLAHRAAVTRARQVYATELPEMSFDAVVVNAYPKDTELLQATNALNVLVEREILKPGGTIVLVAACSEGRGYHALYDFGMRLYSPVHKLPKYKKLFRVYNFVIFSNGVRRPDLRGLFPNEIVLTSSWQEVLGKIRFKKVSTSVLVFPCASIQLPSQKRFQSACKLGFNGSARAYGPSL